MTLRTLPLTLVASLAVPCASFADGGAFEGVAVFSVGETTPPMQMTWTVKGTRARVEMQRPEGKSFGGAMLMDMKAGTTTMVMPEQKVFMTMDLKAMAEKAAAQRAMDPKDARAAMKPEATGKTETIAGIGCEHYLMGKEHSLDVCAAKGMGVMSRWSPGDAMALEGDMAAFKDGFFPLKMEKVGGGGRKLVLLAMSVEKKSVDDGVLAIPAGFTEMKMPAGMGMGMPGAGGPPMMPHGGKRPKAE